ncbi:hypothetical protein GGTG_09960 [Gaeumannomyces tritici R3-111a-1]|uniref:DAGKc domain-containing protein n=1 Tax=Gaeumannomyces tritici (strain R3-111a-1) TaxID=644352 RepID=J3P8X5_GAET3|nr:hypothetical protein GGTG_09960 [Gaeumannomyces tritici R3-111a-1]EJT73110.1 hypothetical protein GGTG_09960 [Gaeumannomyces tritici R3-111a-1]
MAHDRDTLVLGSRELEISKDELLVRGTTDGRTKKKKSSRTCGLGSSGAAADAPQSIPLYNILWAEVSDGALTVDYAQDLSKTCLRAAKLSIPLPTTTTPTPTPPTEPSADAAAPTTTTTTTTDAPEAAATAWAALLLDRSYDAASTRRKRAYVLINPHAGPGGAVQKFESEVRPIFEAARMTLTVVTTARPGEASELVQALDPDAYDVVAAASGDGLVYEVFNGLGRRPDARRALGSLAVVHIPCGSGNAMACNLYGTHRPAAAALAAVKGVPTPMDLVSVTQGGTRTLSFLSQSLGIIAEADLATEDLRWMGSSRFTYGFLVRCFKRAVYPCDVSVKVEMDDKAKIKKFYSRYRSGSLGEAPGEGSGGGDGGGSGSSNADEGSSVEGAGEGLPPLKYGTINDKIPDGWETFSLDKLGNFYCGNMAYMMPENNMFSAACIDDGLLDLVTVDGDISPLKSVSLMTSVENGKFFDDPLVSYRKVSAYRVTPRNQADGYISIDGERVPFEPFQCEVHRSLGLVISRRGLYEAPGPRGWDKVSVAERIMA